MLTGRIVSGVVVGGGSGWRMEIGADNDGRIVESTRPDSDGYSGWPSVMVLLNLIYRKLCRSSARVCVSPCAFCLRVAVTSSEYQLKRLHYIDDQCCSLLVPSDYVVGTLPASNVGLHFLICHHYYNAFSFAKFSGQYKQHLFRDTGRPLAG